MLRIWLIDMKRLVEFSLEDGSTVLIEAEDLNYNEEIINASPVSPQEIIKVTNKKFEEYIEAINPVADAISTRLRNLHSKPTEIEVSFGINVDLKAGMFISANTGSNFKVTLKWNNKN
jgi:hypothetical protein